MFMSHQEAVFENSYLNERKKQLNANIVFFFRQLPLPMQFVLHVLQTYVFAALVSYVERF